MKNILKSIKSYIPILLAISAISIACQDDDTIQRTGKPNVTVTNNTVTVTEGETAIFNLNVEYAINSKIDIRIDVIDQQGNILPVANPTDGDANSGDGFYDRIEFEDFNVPYNTWFESGWFEYGYLGGSGYVASIDPYQSSFELNIETIQDFLPENTKSIQFKLSSTSLMEGIIDEIITVNILDYIGEDLIVNLNWAGDYLESSADACDIDSGLDMDLELIFGGNYVQTSYNDCPEELIILGTDPDGSYIVDASLWTSNGNTSTDNSNIPVSIDFIKAGVFIETVDLSSLFPLNDGGLLDGNGNAITSFTVQKTGTIFTVLDSNDDTVVQGRNSTNRKTVDEKLLLKER